MIVVVDQDNDRLTRPRRFREIVTNQRKYDVIFYDASNLIGES